ncbi:MAG TPA: hypothetical protein VII62_11880 [Vicinamibacteria bacterium]
MRSTARVLVALATIAVPVTAQTMKESLDIKRQAIANQRRVLVSGALPLTDDEAKGFWPLYDAYEKQRGDIDERTNRLVADFVAIEGNLSDTQAKAMLAVALRLDDERLVARRDALGRMSKVLPPRKLMRYFQIEQKLDAQVRADISRQVPLTP